MEEFAEISAKSCRKVAVQASVNPGTHVSRMSADKDAPAHKEEAPAGTASRRFPSQECIYWFIGRRLYRGAGKDQYIPPPGAPAGSGLSSFNSLMIASVVSSRPAIEAAFCNAVRSTLVGTMTPIFIRSPYSWVRAL